MAWLAEAQARETLHASTRLGRSGINAISRAMLGASTDGITVPNAMRSSAAGSRSDRCTNSLTAILPSSIALSALRVVPAFAKGVRTPAMIAMRLPGS